MFTKKPSSNRHGLCNTIFPLILWQIGEFHSWMPFHLAASHPISFSHAEHSEKISVSIIVICVDNRRDAIQSLNFNIFEIGKCAGRRHSICMQMMSGLRLRYNISIQSPSFAHFSGIFLLLHKIENVLEISWWKSLASSEVVVSRARCCFAWNFKM